MSEIDVQRLKNDPAYWDEVAPEGAAAYVEADPVANRSHEGVGFFAAEIKEAGSGTGWEGVKMDGTTFHVFAGYWNIVLRPTQPQWRGPEDGLPPVGTVAMGKMPAWRKEERCKVIAHLHGSCVVVHGIGDNPDSWSTLSWCDQFRPLKSDKERAVEMALREAGYSIDGPYNDDVRTIVKALRKAYSAGLLRLPEDQS